MGILDDAVVNAKAAATAVGKKAENIIDVSKLKLTETGIKNNVDKKMQALGCLVYKLEKEGALSSSAIAELYNEITELNEQLEATRSLIAKTKNKILCSSCGAEIDNDVAFCCRCGSKVTFVPADEDITQEDIDAASINPECDTEINQAD